MKKDEFRITTPEEARIYLLGVIEGLNRARLTVWGFGYDKDETAQIIRSRTSQMILDIKEMLDIQFFGEQAFVDVRQYLKYQKQEKEEKANAQST